MVHFHFFNIFPTLSTYYDPSILILSLLHVSPPPPLLCSSSAYDNIRGKNNIVVYSNPIERFWMCVSFITLLTQLECFWKKNYSNWIRTKNSEWNQSIGISTFFEFARLILLIVLFCFLSLCVRFLKAMSKHLEK